MKMRPAMYLFNHKMIRWGALIFLLLYVAAVVVSPVTFAEQSAQAAREAASSEDVTDLAKKTQNPVSDLISLPFQNNVNFGAGPKDDRIQDIFNIQPVIPIGITKDWNLIVRTIVPLIWRPEIQKESGHTFGLGDINPTFFLSPKNSGKVTWGAGPTMIFPTATDGKLGSRKWNLGPSLVVLAMPRQWVIGALLSQSWSLGGDDDRRDTAPFLLQYFVNYNFPRGWYFTSSPIITAD
jgi:hypothetical protein